MSIKMLSNNDEGLVLEVHIPFETIMLNGEQCIEQVLNEAGTIASGELLKCFDANGSAIQIGATKLTSKGRVSKTYQTPYGDIQVNRHLYQTAQGGSHLLSIGISRQNHPKCDSKTGENTLTQIFQTECR